MNRKIMVFDAGKLIGYVDIDLQEPTTELLHVYEITNPVVPDSVYILYLADMDYGMVISKEAYDKFLEGEKNE
jgi:hypothetical protein